MKTFLILCIIILGCTQSKKIQPRVVTHSDVASDSNLYKIYKVDSLNSYYLIYAKKKDILYKIISKKDGVKNDVRVRSGGVYDLKLYSIWTKGIVIDGINVSPSMTPNVTCLNFDDSTRICVERDSINDLHQAENLRGLYLIRK